MHPGSRSAASCPLGFDLEVIGRPRKTAQNKRTKGCGMAQRKQDTRLHRLPAPGFARASCLSIALSALVACQSLPSLEQPIAQLAEPQSVQLMSAPSVGVVSEKAPYTEVTATVDDQTASVSQPLETVLTEPFVLRFTEATPGTVMRALALRAKLEYTAEGGALEAGSVSMEMTFQTTTDVYAAVKTIAAAAGLEASWDGNRVSLTRIGAVDGVSRGWYITSATLSETLLQAVNERYSLSCVQSRVLVCLGDPADIQQAEGLIARMAALSGQVPHVAMRSDVDISGIVQALGLEGAARVTNLGGGVQIVSAANNATLEVIRLALQNVSSAGACERRLYQPLTALPAEIIAAVSLVPEALCTEPLEIRGRVVVAVAAGTWPTVLATVAAIDVPRPVSQMTVYIVTANETQNAGALFRELEASIPTGRFAEALDLSLGRNRGLAVRSVQLATQDAGQASRLVTQRLAGATAVVDGTVLQGVDQRSYGLQASFDGIVTESAAVGTVTISDSALEGQDTSEVRCVAPLDLPLGMAQQVCAFADQSGRSELSLGGYSRTKADGETRVYIAAEKSPVYFLSAFNDALSTLTKGSF